MKRRGFFSAAAAVVLSLILTFVPSIRVSAAENPWIEITSGLFNKSSVSSEEIYLGESVKITAKTAAMDAKKCKFAYLSKYEDTYWTTMKNFSTLSSYNWKPKSAGKYTVCVKVLSPMKIAYKKFFTVTVKPKLENRSVVSAAYINTEDSVTIAANAIGGTPEYKYAFYMKKESSGSWQTLSGFGNVETMTWTPSESGVYKICVKVKDKKSKIADKYFTLNVSPQKPTSPEYKLSVKAPVTAPYRWSCEVSDESILSVSPPVIGGRFDIINASVMLEYRVKTLRAGAAVIEFTYNSCDGKKYTLKYNVTVVPNLNMEVTSSEGEYFDDSLPEFVQKKKTISVKLDNSSEDCKWNCSISDSNIADVDFKKDSGGKTEYSFDILRSGHTSVNLMYVSNSGTVTYYYVVYNIYVDEDLNAAVESTDGYYVNGSKFPEMSG